MAIKMFDLRDFWPSEVGEPVVGLDLGSRSGKAVMLAGNTIYAALTPTGICAQETAEYLIERLLKQSGHHRTDIRQIVGTGYGNVALNFEDIPARMMTEISCHALGAHTLQPETRSIVDIGGQDSKAIRIDPLSGNVEEFILNDRCAAGTGRFLEKVAHLLDLPVEILGDTALKADKPCEVSSQCVVFAESEIISLKAKGEKPENIAAGVHMAIARKARNLLLKVKFAPPLFFSGGVSNNAGLRSCLEQALSQPVTVSVLDAVYTGALGAAVYALQHNE
jgi:predicted CoA-substrate-specific enzyme activase